MPRNKAFLIDYSQLVEFDHTDELCVRLTMRELQAVWVQLEYLGWVKRYYNVPQGIDAQLREFKEAIEFQFISAQPCGDEPCQEDEFCMTVSQDIIDKICACVSDSTAAITDAIAQSDEKSAIESFYTDSGTVRQEVPESVLDEPLSIIPDGNSCDNDIAFNVSQKLVDWLDKSVVDIFQEIVGSANAAEYVVALIDSAPVVGAARRGLLGFIDFATELDDWSQQNYESSWTLALADDMACRLFQVVSCQNCEVSLLDVIEVYERKISDELGRVISNSPFASVASVLDELIIGASDVSAVVAQYGLLQMIRLLDSLGIGLSGYDEFIQEALKASNDGNNDWVVECGSPECEWVYNWVSGDDTSPLAANAALSGTGLWVIGTGTITADTARVASNAGYDAFQLEFTAATATRAQFEFSAFSDNGVVTRRTVLLRIDNPTQVDKSIVVVESVETEASLVVASDDPSEDISIGFLSINDSADQRIELKSIEIRGVGVNPFDIP